MAAEKRDPAAVVTAVRSRRRALVFSRAFYACYYAAGASLIPFLALYYSQLGFSGRQIGILRAIAPLITLLSAPLWSALADATRRHKLFWSLAIAGTWGGVFALSRASAYTTLLGIVLAHAFFAAPVTPLLDSAVLALLGKQEERYGELRLWGAIGWGVGGYLVGTLIDRYGLSWSFIGYLILMAGAGAATIGIPATYARERADADERGKKRRSFRSDLGTLLSNPSWVLFLLTILVGGLYLAIEINYLMLYVDRLGGSETLMGAMLAVSMVSELPVWALAPRWLRRWGPRGVLSIALLAGSIQALAYAWMPALWVVLPVQLLHGLAFSAMWSAGVAYAADIAPEGTLATAQGLLGAVQMGLTSMLGAFIGGLIFEAVGGARLFLLASAAPVTALVLMWAGVRRSERRELTSNANPAK